jgi:hypothetical protein
MIYFVMGLLAVVLPAILLAMVMEIPGHSRRKARMSDLDKCNEHARLASKAMGRDDGEYEYHMRMAVSYFDRSDNE